MSTTQSDQIPDTFHESDIFIDDDHDHDDEIETNTVIPPPLRDSAPEHDILFESLRTLAESCLENSKITKQQYKDLVEYAQLLQAELAEVQDRIIEARERMSDMKQEYDQHVQKSQQLETKQTERKAELKDLAKEMQKAEKQLALAQEQESDIQMAIIDKERKIARLEQEIMKKKSERERLEQPIIEAYTRDIQLLKEESKEQVVTFKKYKEQREELLKNIDVVQDELKTLEDRRIFLQNQYNAISTAPERSKKQADMVTKAFLSTKEDLGVKTDLVKQLQLKIKEQEQRKEAIIDTTFVMKRQEDHELKKLITIEKEIKQYKAKYLQEADAYKLIAGRTFSLEQELQQKKKSLASYHDLLRAKKKEEEVYIQQLHRLREHNKALLRGMEKAEAKKDQINKAREKIVQRMSETELIFKELKSDVDILIHKFLGDEKVSKDLHDLLMQKEEESKALDTTIRNMVQEERETDKTILELSVERETIAREAARSKQQFLDCIADTKSIGYVNEELRKTADEIDRTNKMLKKMYSMIKKDRNKYAKIIQDNMQTLTLIAENRKTIESEHEVLSKKSLAKEKQLLKVRRQHDHHFANRESLRSTYSKHEMALNEKHQAIAECDNELGKLNAIIALTEDRMIDLKKSYEERVEQRNFTNIQLMDRNDELSILYEKAHVQQGILTKGENELERRNKQYAALQVDLSNAEREVSLLLKQIPDLRAAQSEKEHLIRQMEEARELTEEFAADMEDPQNDERWRRLPGEVPTDEQLDSQLHLLEKKIASRKEHFMEKKLILEELTTASDKLRTTVVTGRDKTFDISVGMNDVQAKIRTTDHKMMALLSELSIYQATAMTQGAHITQLRNNLERGLQRLDNGEPPSEEMEWEWRKARELEMRRRQQLVERREQQKLLQDLPASITRTTALQRPTSYIPQDSDLAIPRPYAFKPFMYSSPGANMRHFRAPDTTQRKIIF